MVKQTVLLILTVACPFGRILAADWPQWRGPERTGLSKETGLLPSWPPGGPKLLWTFHDAGHGYSSMSVVGDRLYTMGADGDYDDGEVKEYVYALDLNTRKKLWSVEVGRAKAPGGSCSTPTVDGNYLYALANEGNLVCVETASGKRVWSQGLKTSLGGLMPQWRYCESPLVDGDLVVVTPGSKRKRGAVAAFDKKTGTLKWRSTPIADRSKAPASSMIAIELGGVRQFVQWTTEESMGNVLAGLRASDGKLLWQFTCTKKGYSSAPICTPIYRDGRVYVSAVCECQQLKILSEGDRFQAKGIYVNQEILSDQNSPVLVDKYLYGFDEADRSRAKPGWVCQDFQKGKTVWEKNTGRLRDAGTVVYADGNLYCCHESGNVLLLKATPDGYQEQGKFRIQRDAGKRSDMWASPTVANGKLYLRDHERIFCYDIRKPQ